MENENYSGSTGDSKSVPPLATPDEDDSNTATPAKETAKMTDDATKVKFTNANSNFNNRNGDAKVDIENIQVAFAGMGKDELMKFANDPFWIRLRWSLFALFWIGWLAMLVGAIVIIVQAPRCPPLPTLDWWQKSVIYQIYPRSFADSNGDGVGDLKGIEDRVDYLADLEVGAVWLSPIFKSPMVDLGYDVEDYKEVDESYGSLEDVRSLVAKLNEKEIKLILDFVPNHTSNKASWFEQSRQRVDPYTDYYIWADGPNKNSTKPPNNWVSVFGGSAWTWDDTRKQFYYHQFLPEQPDLNLRNPKVKEELKNVLQFWMDYGVRGFRVDAVAHLFEDVSNEDEPALVNATIGDPTKYEYWDHIYTTSQPEVVELIQEWRQFMDKYSEENADGIHMLLMVESYEPIPEVMRYYGNETNKVSDFPFNFNLLETLDADVTASKVSESMQMWLENMPKGAWPNWVLGNHDVRRVGSRVDPGLIDGLHMITMLMTGTPVTYYGEEIGMHDVVVTFKETQDPFGLKHGEDDYSTYSRDPSRSPMQWDNSTNSGFSNSSKLWLPINPDYKEGVNVKDENGTSRSHLKIYKRLTHLRSEPPFRFGSVGFLQVVDNVFGFSRVKKGIPGYVVLVNFGQNTTSFDLTAQPEVDPKNYVNVIDNAKYAFPEEGDIILVSANVLETSPLFTDDSTKRKVRLSQVLLGANEAVVIKFVQNYIETD